jgi:8-oxo-dGTP pyrophosphatase MutT (NUDIX family)
MGVHLTDIWKKALAGKLPGAAAQARMSPEFRGEYVHRKDPLEAAVMALLYPHRQQLHLVFMKRNEYDGPHSAQVSFPGGAREVADQSLAETALRETREELGIGEDIKVLGALTPLHIPVSNFMVHPFVGWAKERPNFRPDASEVQYLIESTLDELLDPGAVAHGHWDHHGRSIRAPYYKVNREKIWGATAMMLCELLQLAASLPSHRY